MKPDTDSLSNEAPLNSHFDPLEVKGDYDSISTTQEFAKEGQPRKSVKYMIFKIFLDSIPLTLSFFSFLADRSILIGFLKSANLGNDVIAAFGIATSFQILSATSIISALQSGLLSRVSQAYGANDIKLAGLYCQRGQIINLGAVFVCLTPFLFAKNILILLNATEEEAEMGQEYLYIVMPALGFQLFFYSYSSVLNGCKIYLWPAICIVIGSALQLSTGYLFISEMNMGLKGAGMALSIGWFVSLLSIMIVIKCKDPVPGLFFSYSRESFIGLWDLLKFELFCGFQLWAGFVALEINNMTAIRFNKDDQAAYTVSTNNYKLFLSPVFGWTTSLQSHLGVIMGYGDAKFAKNVFNGTIIASLAVIGLIEVVAFIIREPIMHSQTDSSNFDTTIALFQIYQIKVFVEFVNELYQAASKTIGKEKLAAKLALLVYIIYNIPATFTFAIYFDWGVYGLAIATTSGAGISALLFVVLTYSMNWEKQVKIVSKALKITRRISVDFNSRRNSLRKSIEGTNNFVKENI